jgi:hypothetical protein
MRQTFPVLEAGALAVLLILGAGNALAKCPAEGYEITGRVTTRAGVPVADAIVTARWTDATGGGEASANSSQGGSYRVEFRSSTLSGDDEAHFDICKATLSSVTLDVAAPAWAPESAVVQIKDRKGKADFSLMPKAR